MGKTPKTVHFNDEQIEAIEELEKTDPVMRDRGFGWIVRWLLDKALGLEEKEAGDEANQT